MSWGHYKNSRAHAIIFLQSYHLTACKCNYLGSFATGPALGISCPANRPRELAKS
jgi:hypothetical protein